VRHGELAQQALRLGRRHVEQVDAGGRPDGAIGDGTLDALVGTGSAARTGSGVVAMAKRGRGPRATSAHGLQT
jgi:hypothetical protein